MHHDLSSECTMCNHGSVAPLHKLGDFTDRSALGRLPRDQLQHLHSETSWKSGMIPGLMQMHVTTDRAHLEGKANAACILTQALHIWLACSAHQRPAHNAGLQQRRCLVLVDVLQRLQTHLEEAHNSRWKNEIVQEIRSPFLPAQHFGKLCMSMPH